MTKTMGRTELAKAIKAKLRDKGEGAVEEVWQTIREESLAAFQQLEWIEAIFDGEPVPPAALAHPLVQRAHDICNALDAAVLRS